MSAITTVPAVRAMKAESWLRWAISMKNAMPVPEPKVTGFAPATPSRSSRLMASEMLALKGAGIDPASVNLILVSRSQAKLDHAAEELRGLGAECITVSADLSKPEGSTQAIAAAGDREVGLVVTNCGADSINSTFLDADIAAWEGLAAMNVTTKLRLAHHFGRAMRAVPV